MLRTSTFFIFSFILLSPALRSQQIGIQSNPINNDQSSQLEFRDDHLVADTIFPVTLTEECLAMTSAAPLPFQQEVSWGYFFGTNAFADIAKAQRFDFDNNMYKVTGALVFFGGIGMVGDGEVHLSVLEVTEGGWPGDVVTHSDTLNVSELAGTSGDTIFATAFTFADTSFTHSQQHYISVNIANLAATQDTLGILSSPNGCGDGLSTFERLSFDPGNWYSFGGLDAGGINELNVDLVIGSIVQFETTPTSLDPYVKKDHLTMYPAVPNPAIDELTIKFDLDRNEKILLQIYHVDGRQISSKNLGMRTIGEHAETININHLPTGSYLYGIRTESTSLMSRFVIQR